MAAVIFRNLGPTIRRARKIRGWTQTDLARACEPPYDRTLISFYENGARAMSMESLQRIGDALRLSPGQIVRGELHWLDRIVAS